MNETTASTITQDAFETFLMSRSEPSWLSDLRRNAWNAFLELPMPQDLPAGPRLEEWRRTDVRRFHFEKFPLPSRGASCQLASNGHAADRQSAPQHLPLLTAGVDLAGQTAALDSVPGKTSLDPALPERGVLFGSLDELVQQHSAQIEPFLHTRAVDPYYDKFAALHAACWSGGMLLYVPKGVTIDRPLHMFSALSAGQSDFGHALIVLEEGAQATVLAETASHVAAAAGLHCGAVEILVGPGAKLRYVNLQNWGTGTWHFAHHKALVGRDASLQWTIGALGSRLSKVNQHVALVGEGAHAQVNGVMFTDGTQHLSYHTLQHHEVPHCTSDMLYKGALQGESRLVWRGMIKVDRDAQKTDGYQRDDNLILSESARADSIPGLEIEADDVKCTHGATAGRVDDEQVFYAQARGLTRKEAIRMIVAGFFQQVFDRITVESVREALGRAIGRRVREYE
jgi:Fe-S cluster assembly protein SufD